MSRNAKSVIKSYLDEMAKKDESFAKAYANKEKTLDSCFNYILKEARKHGNQVCMTDGEVFGLAVHYYVEGDLKDVKMPSDFQSCTVSDDGGMNKEAKTEAKKRSAKKVKKQDTAGMGCLFDF